MSDVIPQSYYDDFEGEECEEPKVHSHACNPCGVEWDCQCDDPEEPGGSFQCDDCEEESGW